MMCAVHVPTLSLMLCCSSATETVDLRHTYLLPSSVSSCLRTRIERTCTEPQGGRLHLLVRVMSDIHELDQHTQCMPKFNHIQLRTRNELQTATSNLRLYSRHRSNIGKTNIIKGCTYRDVSAHTKYAYAYTVCTEPASSPRAPVRAGIDAMYFM